VHALRVWRCYLESGIAFTVKTDHRPNTTFYTKTTLSRREARWAEFLAQFKYTWVYKPGKENVVADPLSRMHDPASAAKGVHAAQALAYLRVTLTRRVLYAVTTRRALQQERLKADARVESSTHAGAAAVLAEYRHAAVPPVIEVQPPKSKLIRKARTVDAHPAGPKPARHARDQSFLERVKAGYNEDPFFSDPEMTAKQGLLFKDELWWKGSQVAVSNYPAFTETILEEMHDAPLAGHVGRSKTMKAITSLW
jgi:hypothetical protein